MRGGPGSSSRPASVSSRSAATDRPSSFMFRDLGSSVVNPLSLSPFYLTTGRFCEQAACDPLGEGPASRSDMLRAGMGVAYYFMFVKALAWMFALASIFALPQLAINSGGRVQGSWGLASLAQGMLGNLGASAVPVSVSLATTASGGATSALSFGSFTTSALSAVGAPQLPALYSLLDLLSSLVFVLGVLYISRFTADLSQGASQLGVEDYSVLVRGLPRGGGCMGGNGDGQVTGEALAAHFERLASCFTADFRVVRALTGRPEVFLAGAELRLVRVFQARSALEEALGKEQSNLRALEERYGLRGSSRWAIMAPRYAGFAHALVANLKAEEEHKAQVESLRLAVERETKARELAAAASSQSRRRKRAGRDREEDGEEEEEKGGRRGGGGAAPPRSRRGSVHLSIRRPPPEEGEEKEEEEESFRAVKSPPPRARRGSVAVLKAQRNGGGEDDGSDEAAVRPPPPRGRRGSMAAPSNPLGTRASSVARGGSRRFSTSGKPSTPIVQLNEDLDIYADNFSSDGTGEGDSPPAQPRSSAAPKLGPLAAATAATTAAAAALPSPPTLLPGLPASNGELERRPGSGAAAVLPTSARASSAAAAASATAAAAAPATGTTLWGEPSAGVEKISASNSRRLRIAELKQRAGLQGSATLLDASSWPEYHYGTSDSLDSNPVSGRGAALATEAAPPTAAATPGGGEASSIAAPLDAPPAAAPAPPPPKPAPAAAQTAAQQRADFSDASDSSSGGGGAAGRATGSGYEGGASSGGEGGGTPAASHFALSREEALAPPRGSRTRRFSLRHLTPAGGSSSGGGGPGAPAALGEGSTASAGVGQGAFSVAVNSHLDQTYHAVVASGRSSAAVARYISGVQRAGAAATAASNSSSSSSSTSLRAVQLAGEREARARQAVEANSAVAKAAVQSARAELLASRADLDGFSSSEERGGRRVRGGGQANSNPSSSSSSEEGEEARRGKREGAIDVSSPLSPGQGGAGQGLSASGGGGANPAALPPYAGALPSLELSPPEAALFRHPSSSKGLKNLGNVAKGALLAGKNHLLRFLCCGSVPTKRERHWEERQLRKAIVASRGKIEDVVWEIEALTKGLASYIGSDEALAVFNSSGVAAPATAADPSSGGREGGQQQHQERTIATRDPAIAIVTFESAQTAAAMINLHSMSALEWGLRGGFASVDAPAGPSPAWIAPLAAAAAGGGNKDIEQGGGGSSSSSSSKGAAKGFSGGGGKGPLASFSDGEEEAAEEGQEGLASSSKGGSRERDQQVYLGFEGHRLRLERPPPPDTFLWEHAHTSPLERCSRECGVSCIAGILILLSFALVYGSQVLQSAGAIFTGGDATAAFCAATSTAPILAYYGPAYETAYTTSPAPPSPAALARYVALHPSLAYATSLLTPHLPPRAGDPPPQGALIASSLGALVCTAQAALRTSGAWPLDASTDPTLQAALSAGASCAVGDRLNASYTPWAALAGTLAPSLAPYTTGNITAALLYLLSPALGNLSTAYFPGGAASVLNASWPLLLPTTPQLTACHCAAAFVTSARAMIPPGLSGASALKDLWTAAGSWVPPLPRDAGGAAGTLGGYGVPIPVPDWVACSDWVVAYLAYSALVGVAALVVVCINVGMARALDALGGLTTPATTDAARTASLLRNVALQFFNTALLVLLVSAYIPTLPVDTPGQKYSDFTNGWYTNKGPSLVVMMVLQGMVPPLYTLASTALWRAQRMLLPAPFPAAPPPKPTPAARTPPPARGTTSTATATATATANTATSSAAAVDFYTPPQFDTAPRYASHVVLAAVSLTYSSGIPLLTILAALSYALNYWVDYALFLTHFRAPPRESAHVGSTALHFLLPALTLHCLMGAWMLSSSSLFMLSGGATLPGYGVAPSNPLLTTVLSRIPSTGSTSGSGRQLGGAWAPSTLPPLSSLGAYNFSNPATPNASSLFAAASATLAAVSTASAPTFTFSSFATELAVRVTIPYVQPLFALGFILLILLALRLGRATLLTPLLHALGTLARSVYCKCCCQGCFSSSSSSSSSSGSAPGKGAAPPSRTASAHSSSSSSTPSDIEARGDLAGFAPSLKWLSLPMAQRALQRARSGAAASGPTPTAAGAGGGAAGSPQAATNPALGLGADGGLMGGRGGSSPEKAAGAERAARRGACLACMTRSALCLCEAPLSCLVYCSARRRHAKAVADWKDAVARHERQARRGSSSSSSSSSGRRRGSVGGGKAPPSAPPPPPPPPKLYCCGGHWDAWGTLHWVLSGTGLYCLLPRAAQPKVERPGDVDDSGRFVLLPPPPFSTALSLGALSGLPTYSPCANAALVRACVPALQAQQPHLFLRYSTLTQAGLFGYAGVYPSSGAPENSSPSRAAGGLGEGLGPLHSDSEGSSSSEGSEGAGGRGGKEEEEEEEEEEEPSPPRRTAAASPRGGAARGGAGHAPRRGGAGGVGLSPRERVSAQTPQQRTWGQFLGREPNPGYEA
jgi:hypothetical protein